MKLGWSRGRCAFNISRWHLNIWIETQNSFRQTFRRAKVHYDNICSTLIKSNKERRPPETALPLSIGLFPPVSTKWERRKRKMLKHFLFPRMLFFEQMKMDEVRKRERNNPWKVVSHFGSHCLDEFFKRGATFWKSGKQIMSSSWAWTKRSSTGNFSRVLKII